MIRRLEIRNFKSHKDTRIDANNLTVLTGVNSAGKSSLVQALLLLRQSFFKGRLESGLELNGPLCRIGTGQDALCRFANEGEMEFCIRDDVRNFVLIMVLILIVFLQMQLICIADCRTGMSLGRIW